MNTKERFVKKFIEHFEKIDPEYIELFLTGLMRERNFLKDLVNLLDEGILVLNAHREIILINAAAMKILDIIDEDPTGKSIEPYIYDEYMRIFFDKIWDLHDKTVNTELHLTAPRRMYLGVTIMNYTRAEEQEFIGKVFVFSDITERVSLMEKLLQNEKVNTFNLLAAGVAHEIGNPLNSLDIHLQLLEKEIESCLPENKENLLELLMVSRSEISRLDSIITRFLKTIRPFQLQLREYSIIETVRTLLDMMKAEIYQAGLSLELSMPEKDCPFLFDLELMKQAIANIIKNAIQATPSGGEIGIQVSLIKKTCKISITDTGKGIAKQDLKKIFDPYYTTRPEGTGLGLMLVNRIISAHSGEISVISEENEGTNILISLPMKKRGERLLPPKTRKGADE